MFWKMTMSKISENGLFGQKKSPCGVVPQQNKGCKHIPDHSRPNPDQIISKNSYFYSNFIENRGFSIKIAKKIKIVAKALLRINAALKHKHLSHWLWLQVCRILLLVSWHTSWCRWGSLYVATVALRLCKALINCKLLAGRLMAIWQKHRKFAKFTKNRYFNT